MKCTPEEQAAAKLMLADIDMIMDIFEGLDSKLQSPELKQAWKEQADTIRKEYKKIKAEMLVELDLI